MNEVLLTVFDKTLSYVARQMRNAEVSIEKSQGEIEELRKAIKGIEGNLKCKTYEEEQATREVEVLTAYLSRSEKYPSALMDQMEQLKEDQRRAVEARRVVDAQVSRVCSDLRGRQTRLAVLEQDYAKFQKQWGELSEIISQERANGSA